jgi:hypothetical protein
MDIIVAFFSTLMIFGLLMLVLSFKARRDSQRPTSQACGHGHVCQCRSAQHVIQQVVKKEPSEK